MAGAARLVDLCCTGVLFQGSTRMNLFVSRQKSQEGSSLRSVLVLCCPVFYAVKVGLNTVWNKVCKYLMVLCSAFVGAIRFTRRVSSLGISLWDWRSVFSVGILSLAYIKFSALAHWRFFSVSLSSWHFMFHYNAYYIHVSWSLPSWWMLKVVQLG